MEVCDPCCNICVGFNKFGIWSCPSSPNPHTGAKTVSKGKAHPVPLPQPLLPYSLRNQQPGPFPLSPQGHGWFWCIKGRKYFSERRKRSRLLIHTQPEISCALDPGANAGGCSVILRSKSGQIPQYSSTLCKVKNFQGINLQFGSQWGPN